MDYPDFLHDPRITGSMVKTYQGLRSFDQGSGVHPSVETVATKLGMSERSIQQNIRRLQDVNVLEVKEQFRGSHQGTNFYLFPVPPWASQSPGPIGVQQSAPNTGICSSPSSSSSSSSDGDTPIPLLPSETEGTRRNSGASSSMSVVSEPVAWKRLPRGSVFYTHQDTAQVVDHFEKKLQARDLQEGAKARKIGGRRRWSWELSANALLDDHPVDEVILAVDWLFDTFAGRFPFSVRNPHTGKIDPKQRRVTRLAQVLDQFPRISEMMTTGSVPRVADDSVDAQSMPKRFFDNGIGFPMEEEVTELVNLFARFHHDRNVTDFDLYSWRKTFRIMLLHLNIPFKDVKQVVTALADRKLSLDYGRYFAPYDLHRDGEWQHVLAAVQIAQLEADQRKARGLDQPANRPNCEADDDHDW